MDGWIGADIAQGNAGHDRVEHCEGENGVQDDVLRGGPGGDSFDSATEDYDGGTPCGDDPERDLVYGGKGIDSAVVSVRDSVRHLESVTRVE